MATEVYGFGFGLARLLFVLGFMVCAFSIVGFLHILIEYDVWFRWSSIWVGGLLIIGLLLMAFGEVMCAVFNGAHELKKFNSSRANTSN